MKDEIRKRVAKHILLEHPNVIKAYEGMMIEKEESYLTVLEICDDTLANWIQTINSKTLSNDHLK
jgi:hypothetical protein